MYEPGSDMTLRDWFAAQCPESEMPKLTIGDVRQRFGLPDGGFGSSSFGTDAQWQQMRCEARYRYADMMLKVRNQDRK